MTTETQTKASADGARAPIGIVIPAYGHPRFLGEAIESACTQDTERPIYVVVVDDGCRFKETADLCADMAAAYPGTLHYLRHKNTRLPGARNKGVRFLLNLCPEIDSIFFLDADNRLSPYSIEAYRRVLGDDPSVGWAYPDIAFFGLSWGREGFDIRETAPDYSVLKHLCGNISEAGSLVRASMFRAHVYYDETMRSGFEDWDFWLSALEAGFRGRRVKDAGFLYRRRAESMLADSRREEDQLIAGIRKKHKALFEPGAVMRTLQAEAPTFAIMLEGTDQVILTADPCAAPDEETGRLSTVAFAALMERCRKSPREHFFPRHILMMPPALWAWLQAEAGPFLRWMFWSLLKTELTAACFRFTRGDFPALGSLVGGDAQVLMLGREPFEAHVFGAKRDAASLTASLPVREICLPFSPADDLPALDTAACLAGLYREIDPGVSWLRHTDRRYAGPDARTLVDDSIAPLCTAEADVFPPVPFVRAAGERWFAFVVTEKDLATGTLAPYFHWARDKGYRTLMIVERDRDQGRMTLPEAAWRGQADMVMPLVLEGSARTSRYYLGRLVQSAMGVGGQLEMETLAFHFDFLMATEHAVSLEAFGAARHRGVRSFLLLSADFGSGQATRPETFGRLLAYEHAIDTIIADDADVLAPLLSAQGIPGEKLVSVDQFFPAFAPAVKKQSAPVVMSKPLNWTPSGGYVFIVTYGRSGSTLVQTLLQSFEGYHIRGENENALYEIFRAVNRLDTVRQRYDVRQPIPEHGPWYGADEIDINAYADRMVDAFVAEVLRPPENARVVGFKEIRYGELEPDELAAFLDFIRNRFEQVRIIFNTRNWEAVCASGWWRTMDQDEVKEIIGRTDKVFADYAARHGDHSCLLHYDDYVANPEALRPLFELMGEPYDAELVAARLGQRLRH